MSRKRRRSPEGHVHRDLSAPSLSARSHTLASPSRPGEEDGGGKTVPVMFIAGSGRSGSTLLDRLLGSTPGLHSGGEIDALWDQGLVEDRLCSCGAHFSGCPFWSAVGSNSFSLLRSDEMDAIARYLRDILRAQSTWRIFSRRTRDNLLKSAPAILFDGIAGVYREVRDVSAQQAVVDSSKLPTYLALLAQIPSVDVHIVHLVRDPRAVAHSWQRPVPSGPEGRAYTPRFGLVKSAMLWLIMNAAVEWLAWRLNLPYRRVRYEDLVRDPARVVRELRSEVVVDHLDAAVTESLPEVPDLGVVHSISGNPMRFRQGRTSIAEDSEWKAGPRSRRAVVAAITYPLRWRYGY